MEFETYCIAGKCLCTTTGCPKGECAEVKHRAINVVVDINANKPPVIYTVRIAQHWDGRCEFFIEDVANDQRTRNSVAWALREMADTLENQSIKAVPL